MLLQGCHVEEGVARGSLTVEAGSDVIVQFCAVDLWRGHRAAASCALRCRRKGHLSGGERRGNADEDEDEEEDGACVLIS